MLGVLLSICALLPQGASAGEEAAPVGLTVVVVDVGQGDSAVLKTPDGVVHVVDGGPAGAGVGDVLPVIRALQPAGYGFTFLSHYHDDHSGGLDELLNVLPFTVAWDRGDLRRTNTSGNTQGYLAAAGNRRRQIAVGQVLPLGGGVTVRCVAVNGIVDGGPTVAVSGQTQEENARSVALRLDYGDFSMWLGGDLTGGGNLTPDVESPAALACGDVDVYKVDHHGSNTSTNLNLVSRLDPELAVVSAGVANPFGHPTIPTVNRLNQPAAARLMLSTTRGSGNVIGFGVLGDIAIATDGRRYRVTAENGEFLDLLVDEVTAAPAVGEVRISEIHRNPSRVPDANGEYFEVMSTVGRPLALKSVRLSDNGGTVDLAANYMLLPGRPLLFVRDGDAGRNGGLPLGVTLPFGALSLNDGSDLLAVQRAGATLDRVSWSSGFPGGSGVAAERRDLLAAGAAANFAPATASYGAGDRGSPARRNDADVTPWPVLADAEGIAGELVVRGTAVDQGARLGVLGISFGTNPGFPVLGVQVPLNLDPLLQVFLAVPGAFDAVPAEGYRSLALLLPSPNPVAGAQLFAAHLVLDPAQATVIGVSAPRPFTLQ